MSLSRDDYRSRILEDFLEDVLGYKDGASLAKAYEEAHDHYCNTNRLRLSDYRLAKATHLDMAILYGYICEPARELGASEYQDVPVITALAPSRQEFLEELLDYARARAKKDTRYETYYSDEYREFYGYFKMAVEDHKRDFSSALEHTTIVSPEAAVDDDRVASDYVDA